MKKLGILLALFVVACGSGVGIGDEFAGCGFGSEIAGEESRDVPGAAREGLNGEGREGEGSLGKNGSVDGAIRDGEMGADGGVVIVEAFGDGERGVDVSACAAAREEDGGWNGGGWIWRGLASSSGS